VALASSPGDLGGTTQAYTNGTGFAVCRAALNAARVPSSEVAMMCSWAATSPR
jgi:hypothetical protein